MIAAAEADLSAEALAKAGEGMAQMSKVYDGGGRELYMGAGDREYDGGQRSIGTQGRVI